MKKLNLIRKSFVKMPLTLIACVLLLICAFVYADHDTGLHRTIQNATSHQPENFTELYFSDYKSLPKLIVSGKSYPVHFIIANHESKTFTYTYQTELTGHGMKVISKPATVTINDGQSVSKTAHIFARQPNDHVELVIRVLNINLTIHYKAQS